MSLISKKMKLLLFISVLIVFHRLSLSLSSSTQEARCKVWLVQSIPTDMPQLSLVPGVLSTADVFRWLAGNSTKKLDIMAQYWQLVAQPDDPHSGDFGYTKEEMQMFGAQEGLDVYKAIENAADRNVRVRFLQHSGVYPDYTKEPSDLASGRPHVKNVTLLLGDWWGSGIIHAKVWMSDRQHMYVGSANNDWKSLTQVKEVGIYFAGCRKITKMVKIYYNNFWNLASLNASEFTTTTWDQQWQINRTVPCWSYFIPDKERCRSPFPHRFLKLKFAADYPALSDPFTFQIPFDTPGYSNCTTASSYSSYLSFAPPELLFKEFQTDEQAWVGTIKSASAGGVVRINTMEWLAQSQYTKQTVYWSSLSSAISEVVLSKKATVKLLVARWAHFISNTDEYLKHLLYTNFLCHSSRYNHCKGKVEIKYFEVPGYMSTGPALSNGTRTGNRYPGYTRVNHGKYAVSDVRAHIGTSNLGWDYFYTMAGVSFGTYNPAIVSQLQHIFDADWNSPYAVPIGPLQGLASAS